MKERITPVGESLFVLLSSSFILARPCGCESFGLGKPGMRICVR